MRFHLILASGHYAICHPNAFSSAKIRNEVALSQNQPRLVRFTLLVLLLVGHLI